MIVEDNVIRCCALAVFLLAAAGMASPAWAGADASAWSQGLHARARLIAGPAEGGEAWHAGIEIALDPGFKTYWRTPGSSGVPPVFDFSRSRNLKQAKVLFPAPIAFFDGAGDAIGYKDKVILPVSVTPQDASLPVDLVLKMDYAVCEKLCIPVQANAALTLGAEPMTQPTAAELARFEAQVPRRAPAGAAGIPAVLGIERKGDAAFAVSVRTGAATAAQLFAEGPAGWYYETHAGAPAAGSQTFTLSLVEKPADAAADGARVLLTVVTAGGAVETELPLPP